MSSSCRIATLKLWWPDLLIGVWRIPFKASLFLFREATDSRNISSRLPGEPLSTPDTSTCSQSMGTLSALKIVLTLSATSAPIPSPGIRVTVYLPPYFVGLKISDWTVAKDRVAFWMWDCWRAAVRARRYKRRRLVSRMFTHAHNSEDRRLRHVIAGGRAIEGSNCKRFVPEQLWQSFATA